ncbi:hypothetical protein AYO44_17500 [Planctomycetaceae bacterium SCGC AG-212-F19]|nr:hypothetical protein AYO44_17500 [Planctomycetaceae bacterium SCGC AG-212-F19]
MISLLHARRRRALPGLLLLALPLSAALVAAGEADPPARLEFLVHSASGSPVKGQLKQIDEQWNVLPDAPKPVKIAGADLISIRRVDLPLPGPPAGQQVVFANGDRLPGAIGDLTGERLTLRSARSDFEAMTLPLSALAVLWFETPAGMERPDLVRRRLLLERRSRDVIWLRNGDQLQGNVVKLDREALFIEVDRKQVKVDRGKLAIVAFNNELVRTLRPKEPYAQLVLADGCRLGVASVRLDGNRLTGKTLFGATVTLPLADLRALDIRQGRAVYLSDLKPASYHFTPYFPRLAYGWVADGSIGDGSPAGDEMRLAGSTFGKGIGMHSESRISYALDGAYRRFEALVGLDDRGGANGSVRIKVLVDGKPRELGLDKELTGRDGPKEVRLDVAGARTLTLAVEYGRFDQGQVNWADARLVK